MNKNYILAIFLALLIFGGSFFIQRYFFQPKEQTFVQDEKTAQEIQKRVEDKKPIQHNGWTFLSDVNNSSTNTKDIIKETNLFKIVFTKKGGNIKSLLLKNHLYKEKPIEMLLNGEINNAFALRMGNYQASILDTEFQFKENNGSYEFFTEGKINNKELYRIKKIFTFKSNEYLFDFYINFEKLTSDANETQELTYTLDFGGQIGPEFTTLNNSSEYRQSILFANNSKKVINVPKNSIKEINSGFSWAAIDGKYFSMIVEPLLSTCSIIFLNEKTNIPQEEKNSLFVQRNNVGQYSISDKYKVFIGPKIPEILKKYNTAEKNEYKYQNMKLDKILDEWPVFYQIEWILKRVLIFFYWLIPNYGIAIILLTILTRFILYPLTKIGMKSSQKMQQIGPKIKEVREKFVNDPAKLNQEIAEIYKNEKINPVSGCLPYLLQLPIMIALYNVLRTFFDLRGASFIPPWINDLSAPESIFVLPFTIPFIGTEIRILPFLMLATQMITSKMTSATQNDPTNQQMKLLTYVLPIVMFLFFYNLPSGFMLYWTVLNILQIIQQAYYNYSVKRKER